jgi:hypothetical protein
VEKKMLNVFAIYSYVKDKLKQTEKGTSAYEALFDVYSFIRQNMNASYGATTGEDVYLTVGNTVTLTLDPKQEERERYMEELKKLKKELEINGIHNENM